MTSNLKESHRVSERNKEKVGERTHVFSVRSRLASSDVKNDTDDDEDYDSGKLEARTP